MTTTSRRRYLSRASLPYTQRQQRATVLHRQVRQPGDGPSSGFNAPSWTVTTGEKDNSQLGVEPSQEGCPTSFLMQERGEIGGICNEQPNPKEQYVQPDSEKEDGGEG
jgi:hypothetical protein